MVSKEPGENWRGERNEVKTKGIKMNMEIGIKHNGSKTDFFLKKNAEKTMV